MTLLLNDKFYYHIKNRKEDPDKEWKNVACRNVRNSIKCTAIGQYKGVEVVLNNGRSHNSACDRYYKLPPQERKTYLGLVGMEASLKNPSAEMAAYFSELNEKINPRVASKNSASSGKSLNEKNNPRVASKGSASSGKSLNEKNNPRVVSKGSASSGKSLSKKKVDKKTAPRIVDINLDWSKVPRSNKTYC